MRRIFLSLVACVLMASTASVASAQWWGGARVGYGGYYAGYSTPVYSSYYVSPSYSYTTPVYYSSSPVYYSTPSYYYSTPSYYSTPYYYYSTPSYGYYSYPRYSVGWGGGWRWGW